MMWRWRGARLRRQVLAMVFALVSEALGSNGASEGQRSGPVLIGALGLDRLPQNQVDTDPEQPLQERLEIHVGVARRRVELDDEVEITLHACGALGSGSEQAESTDAVAENGWSMRLKRSKALARGQTLTPIRDSEPRGIQRPGAPATPR